MMNPGIYANISNADYHGGAGVSNSMLSVLREKSPLHLKALRDSANDNEPTPAQLIGTAFHALVLEPEEFIKTYCLGLRMSDVPDAVDDREVLVAMVQAINAEREAAHPGAIKDRDQLVAMLQELNAKRLPKLPTGGSKAEQVARILALVDDAKADAGEDFMEWHTAEQLDAMKGAELKAIIEAENAKRPGLLSTTGNMNELAASLRANGVELVLWSEIVEGHQEKHGTPYIGNCSTASRHDMAEWLRANDRKVTLWSDVKDEWLRNNSHRIVLEQDAWDQVHAMREAAMAHPAARAVLTGCKYVTEHSVYAEDEETGELRRVRPDLWRFDGIVGDLKSTEDASPEGFAQSIAKWGYDVQHPYYLDTINAALQQQQSIQCEHPTSAKQFVFVVVEKKAPHAVAVYVLDNESVDVGRAKYRSSLDTYFECKRTNVWPGYGDKVQTISLPQWHLRKFADAA